MPRRERNYDSTVARMAGNIIGYLGADEDEAVTRAVRLARKIIAEVTRTEPPAEGDNEPTDHPSDKRAT